MKHAGISSILLFAAATALAAPAFADPPADPNAPTATVAEAPPLTPPPPPQAPLAALSKENRRVTGPADWLGRARSFLGLFVMIGIAYAFSNSKKHVDWRLVGVGTALQIVLGLFTRSAPGEWVFSKLNDVVLSLLQYTAAGSTFLFGRLAVQNNMPVAPSVIPMPPPGADLTGWLPGATMAPLASPTTHPWEFVNVGAFFAFGVLPTIIFFSSLMAITYHLGIMQRVVYALALVMQKTMRTSGAETLSAAGNIFLGQTEAPLMVKPYIAKMTQSELMAIMVGGFANTAGGVMAAYVGMLHGVFPDIAGHLVTASMMSAPASLVIAKLMVPEPDREKSATYGKTKVDLKSEDANVIDAAARGASEGLTLALNVGAMLLAFIALIAMLNGLLGWAGHLFGAESLTIELMLGWLLRPIAFALGVPWVDCQMVGSLLGVKTVLNEFVAYQILSEQAGLLVDKRSLVIVTYALCGFANFGSIGIQIGGLAPMAPERRSDLARLGLRAMIGGTLASLMTACVIGMFT